MFRLKNIYPAPQDEDVRGRILKHEGHKNGRGDRS